MDKTPVPFSEQLRQAVKASGLSQRKLAKAVGLCPTALSRFVNNERGLRLDVVDVLVDRLGLRLVKGGD